MNTNNQEINEKEINSLKEQVQEDAFKDFNSKKEQEKIEDTQVSVLELVEDIVTKVQDKKKKERTYSWLQKGVEYSVITAVMWWGLESYSEVNLNQINNITKVYERSFSYFDSKLERLKESIIKTTLTKEQSLLVMEDFLKAHHSVEIAYYDKLLTARYPQECIKDKTVLNCKNKIQSDVTRRMYYLTSKLNKFTSEVGSLGVYFRENYPSQEFLDKVQNTLFSSKRKNYKMSDIKVLILDYETKFIQQFQDDL